MSSQIPGAIDNHIHCCHINEEAQIYLKLLGMRKNKMHE